MQSRRIQLLTTGSRGTLTEADQEAVCAFLKARQVSFQEGQLFQSESQSNHPHFCLPQDLRAQFLKEALYAQEASVLWAFRGGSGTSRLLQTLEAKKPPQEKTVLGFSDITALHLFVTQHWGWHPIHAPTLNSIYQGIVDETSRKLLEQLLHTGALEVSYDLHNTSSNPMHTQITAPVTGGNLSLLSRSIGTPWQVNTTGHMVLIEEVEEPAYRILEMLDHITHARLFDHATAIVLGDLGSCDVHQSFMKTFMEDFLESIQKRAAIPVLTGAPVGHYQRNHLFQYARPATLTLAQNGTASFHQKISLP